MKKRIHATVKMMIVLLASAAFAYSPVSSASGLQSQLNSVFDSMVNVTPPGVFETQRRGVIGGGRFTMKNKIFSENIVSFTPPSWKAGCGGIDMFGGSFSFINSEQLTQLLRSVAANAAGYAFSLAIKTICDSCYTIIETLQKKIQQLNQFMGDSCQLAQGIVNDLASGMDTKIKMDDKSQASLKGFVTDFFTGWSEPKGESATEVRAKNDPENIKVGNIVWMQMKRTATASWFRVSGDNKLLEAIMSITGSVIIKEPVGDKKDTQPISEIPGNKISLKDLVLGGIVEMYSCGGDYDKCMHTGAAGMGNQTERLIGLKTQIEDVFLGKEGGFGGGLIGKYASNSGSLTPTEAAISANLPLSIGTLIFNIASQDEASARTFVTQFAGTLATNMAHEVALEGLRAAQAAIAGEDSPYIIRVKETMDNSRKTIDSQYRELINTYGPLNTAITFHNDLLSVMRKSKYLSVNSPNK